MPDVRIESIDYADGQAAGVPFTVEVEVNNLETVAPLYGSPALCSKGVFSPDGHKIEVTLIVERGFSEVWRETKSGCAPVQAFSQALGGNARIEFEPQLPAGDYTLRAKVEAMPNGSDSSDSKTLTVRGDTSGLDGGSDGSGGGGWNLGDVLDDSDGSNSGGTLADVLDLPDFGKAEVYLWIVLLIALLYAFGQGFDVDVGGGSSS